MWFAAEKAKHGSNQNVKVSPWETFFQRNESCGNCRCLLLNVQVGMKVLLPVSLLFPYSLHEIYI